MKVAFNARLLADGNLRGWNRYTLNLLRGVIGQGVRPYLYSDRPLHSDHLNELEHDPFEVRISPAMKYIAWEQIWLPRQCKLDAVDLLHCPLNFGLPWRSPCPRILTLHDAIDRAYRAPGTNWRNRYGASALKTSLHCWIARRRADHIITVSHHAKADLTDHLHIPAHRITVIYEAADERFGRPVQPDRSAEMRARYKIERPYILYVGGLEQRKNVPFLVKAFAQAQLAEIDLVLVGGKLDEQIATKELARSLGVEPRVKILGWVGDDDLPMLYQAATCFVYPSAYEGFGLQICEAMAGGCPVLAANATSLPEILGDGGETFPIDNPDCLMALLTRVCRDPEYRQDLSMRSIRRASHFSWQITAEKTMEVYRSALQHRQTRETA